MILLYKMLEVHVFLSFAGNVTVIELIVFVKRAGGLAVEPQRDHVFPF